MISDAKCHTCKGTGSQKTAVWHLIKCVFWPWHWKLIRNSGVYLYFECPCGYRHASKMLDAGHQPLNTVWLMQAPAMKGMYDRCEQSNT